MSLCGVCGSDVCAWWVCVACMACASGGGWRGVWRGRRVDGVSAQTHTWKVSQPTGWQSGRWVLGREWKWRGKELTVSHCALFRVLWVLSSESCPSFHARPLNRKWCDFYSNSSTRDLFLQRLSVWFCHLSPRVRDLPNKGSDCQKHLFHKLPTQIHCEIKQQQCVSCIKYHTEGALQIAARG